LDKLDKIGAEGVKKELIEKGFTSQAIQKLQPIFSLSGSVSEKLMRLRTFFVNNSIGNEGLDELNFIFKMLEKNPAQSVTFDLELTLARGLHYYTGMIVEVAPPQDVSIGSIGGGGRYDHLTESFGMKNGSGIGISFGFERLYLVLEALDLFPDTLAKTTQVLFANFGGDAVEMAFQLMQQLRGNNVTAELYSTEAKLKKQLAYADRKKTPYVILIGPEESVQNQFVLKEMTTGNQTTHRQDEILFVLSERMA